MILDDIKALLESIDIPPAKAKQAAQMIDKKYGGLLSSDLGSQSPAIRRDIIKNLFLAGSTIEELAIQYGMAESSIRRMVAE